MFSLDAESPEFDNVSERGLLLSTFLFQVIMNLLWIFSNLSALPDVTLTRAQSEGRGPRR